MLGSSPSRIVRNLVSCIPTLLLIALTPATSRAAEIYDYLPEDALGFVCLHNLEAIDGKVQDLSTQVGFPIPTPLMFVKITTGLDEGINKQGSALIAMLPGESSTSGFMPMALLPISDYEKFAESIQGDPSGEICRISISGEDILLAKHTDYALLMNVEDRETMEIILGLEPEKVKSLEKLTPWLSTTDINVAIMPKGSELLLKLGKAKLSEFENMMETQFSGNAQISGQMEQMKAGFQIYHWILDFMDAEVELVSWGLSIDEDVNIRLGKRVALNKSGMLNSAGEIEVGDESVFQGFSDQEFIFAGGGPFPTSWGEALAKVSKQVMKNMPELYGADEFDDETWEKLEESYSKMMLQTKRMSFLMTPGEKETPLMSGFYATQKVTDSEKYFEEWKKGIELYNEVFAQSTKFNLQYETNPITIADKAGFEMVADIANIMRDPNVPQFNWMMDSMFGKDGKLHYYFIPTDSKTIATSLSNDKAFEEFIHGHEQESGLTGNGHVKNTLVLLDDKAPWKLVVSPAGCVQWVDRIVNELFSVLSGQTVPIPEFPACPPIGISMKIEDTILEGDMVLPGETLKALADYIKTVRQM